VWERCVGEVHLSGICLEASEAHEAMSKRVRVWWDWGGQRKKTDECEDGVSVWLKAGLED
jgi:hypothetical protein